MARLLYSSRTLEDVIYRAELEREEVVHTLTRAQPPGWTGYARRVDIELLREVAWPADEGPLAFVCGPTSFVESVAAGRPRGVSAGTGSSGGVGYLYARGASGDRGVAAVAQWQSFSLPN